MVLIKHVNAAAFRDFLIAAAPVENTGARV